MLIKSPWRFASSAGIALPLRVSARASRSWRLAWTAPTTGGLTKLKELNLNDTQITDAGCAALAAALDSGALPALEKLFLWGIPASAAAKAAVYVARAGANLEGSYF